MQIVFQILKGLTDSLQNKAVDKMLTKLSNEI